MHIKDKQFSYHRVSHFREQAEIALKHDENCKNVTESLKDVARLCLTGLLTFFSFDVSILILLQIAVVDIIGSCIDVSFRLKITTYRSQIYAALGVQIQKVKRVKLLCLLQYRHQYQITNLKQPC